MIVATFTYKIKPGERDAFIAACHECGLLSGAPAEQGCIQYEYFLPLDDPDKLMCYEIWENNDVFVKHRSMPHVVAYQPVKEQYVLDVVKHIYEATETDD